MPAYGSVSPRSKVLADRRWRPVSPSMSPAPRLTSPLSMATHISNPTPRSSFLPACPAGPGREYSCCCRGVSATGAMTGSRATGIACLAGTKAVSSRHRRSPLVLCSTTHRGSSRDRSHPGRRRKASKRLCHSSRTSPGAAAAAAVAHLPMGTDGTAGFDPSGTWRSARGTDLYRSLRFSFTGDRGFESRFLQRRVCLASAFHAYRRKGPAFAGSVSLDETRERDVLATSRLALAAFL